MSQRRKVRESDPETACGHLPLVKEMSPVPDVLESLAAFADQPGVLLLESSLKRDGLGQYSFLTADPLHVWTGQKTTYQQDVFRPVRDVLRECRSPNLPDLPPFQGGVAGLLSYELGGCWERLPQARFDEFELPQYTIGLYDWTLAWDHAKERCWLISQGIPEKSAAQRIDRAASRASWVCQTLHRKQHETSLQQDWPQSTAVKNPSVLQPDSLAPQSPVANVPGLTSDFSRDDYLRMIERVIAYIHAGDIFQANLSQRLLFPLHGTALELYSRLRQRNPAPFSGFFSHDDWSVVSASPERFLRVCDREVETRPIKGTRRREQNPEADLFTRDELRQSEKDTAENVMIVDLLRNDLSRVCQAGSVRVPSLCGVETYETVQHLVSEIRGRLQSDADSWSLLQAVFPGGSVTGAPKIRAMEIIAELEPTVRGPYCGSFFYIGWDGQMDSNILIRTFVCRRGWIQCSVGGGIVAQSDPVSEYEETLHKAEGMLRALDCLR